MMAVEDATVCAASYPWREHLAAGSGDGGTA